MRRKHLRMKTERTHVSDSYDGYYTRRRPKTRAKRKAERVHHLALYRIGRAYGGPEEGGWWYDYGIPCDASELPGLVEERLWAGWRKVKVIDKYPRYGGMALLIEKAREQLGLSSKRLRDDDHVDLLWVVGEVRPFPEHRPRYC